MTTTSPTTTSPSRGVTDRDLLPYLSAVEFHARRLAASPPARQAGAEYDDLVQEGLLAVTLSLMRGVDPLLVVANRMKDWIRLQKRQRDGDPVPYEALLPTESPGGGAG